MAQHKLVVLANAVDGRDRELNDWYTNVHMHDCLKIPGFVAAQRFEISGIVSQGQSWKYLAIYDLDTDDAQAALQELLRRAGPGFCGTVDMAVSSSLDVATVYGKLYKPITPVVKA
jgi:hypothetical protein